MSLAEENADVVRRGYAAFNAGDGKTLLELVDEHASWHTPGRGRVVGLHQNTATRNGRQLDVSCCLVFALKDGRVTDGREYFYDLDAWEEFWA